MKFRSLFKAILRAPGNLLIDSASHFSQRVGRIIRRDASISSRFLPYASESDAWALPPPGEASRGRRASRTAPGPLAPIWQDARGVPGRRAEGR